MQSDYEKLKKAGFTEEEISIELAKLAQLNIGNAPLGNNRDDRSVFVKNSAGASRKTSSIMMGYNKTGIQLENGIYVNSDEIERALAQEFQTSAKDTVYLCKRTGKKIKEQQIITDILNIVNSRTSSLLVNESNKIKNQDSFELLIRDPHKIEDIKKGLFMLGNDGISLPNGQYINGRELLLAIGDYVKMTPQKIEDDIPNKTMEMGPQPLNKGNKTKSETYKIIKRIKKKFSWIPSVTAAVIFFVSGLGMEKDIETEKYQQNLNYVVEELGNLSVEEIDSIVQKKMNDLNTGDKITVSKGQEFYSSSDYKTNPNSVSGEFGTDIRPEGDYTLEYVSVFYKNQPVKTIYENNQNIDEIKFNISRELNCDMNELNLVVHIGGPVSGWMDLDDLIDSYAKNDILGLKVNLVEKERTTGTIDNFTGDTIEIDNSVKLRIRDDNGNLLKPGTIIQGSDGNKYRINNLSTTKQLVMENGVNKEKETLTWSLNNIQKEEALLSAAVAILSLIKYKKKDMVNMTYDDIQTKISEAKKEFDSESEFKKAVEKLSKKSLKKPEELLTEGLIEQEITLEDIDNITKDGRHI